MELNPNIFRQYDIRGVADRDLSDEFAFALGRAFGTFQRRLGHTKLALGRDCRLSSPRLHENLLRGLLETGVSVTDVGIVPSPLLYFAVHHLDLQGGLQITGSHNPAPDNGFKMMKGHGSLYGEDIVELKRIMAEDDYELVGPGSVENVDILPSYVGFLQGNIDLAHTAMKFAIDAGNGAAGPTALAALLGLGLKPEALLCEMDGNFPVHHPDPTDPKTLELLRKTVAEKNLDFGVAYDGDGDRIGIIDAEGNVLWGDMLVTLLARDLLSRRPGAAVLGEVKCSQTMYDDIAAKGGRPILWKTGHSLIKTKMKEEGALLAGEMSGHIFFADRYYGFDDAVYTTARVCEILSRTQKSLGELIADVPKTFTTPELRVPCSDETKFAIVEKVKAHFQRTHEVVDIDGARILFGDSAWGLVRASNTQPVLVLRFEARTEVQLQEIRKQVEEVVEEASK